MAALRVLLMVLLGCRPASAAVSACAAAAAEAERVWALPSGLLLAIGLAETGRPDPATGRLEPTAASVNIGGADIAFAATPYAIDAVTALRRRGIDAIDVGCFQINLRAHPDAFRDVARAFDPRANADYAAGFLRRLFARAGTWAAAVAAYHSADPTRGGPYADRVMRLWRGLGGPVVTGDPRVIPPTAAAAIPVYTPATLPAFLRARLLPARLPPGRLAPARLGRAPPPAFAQP
jgi:hypothetical protein